MGFGTRTPPISVVRARLATRWAAALLRRQLSSPPSRDGDGMRQQGAVHIDIL
jgi:hypothetical protein